MDIILGISIPFIGTSIGALMVFFMKNTLGIKVEKILLGFASGVMIAASIWSLIIPSIEMAEEQGLIPWFPTTIGFILGILFLLLIDMIVPHLENGKVKTVRVDMGEPILTPKEIPVISEEEPVKNLKLKAEDKEFRFTCVSMGNPHAVTTIENTKDFDVKKYGKILEIDKAFPNKTNVEFIEIVDEKHIKMRVWERGAGETLACGTGACASVVACYLNGLTESEVEVELLGGTLKIEWNQKDNHIYMTGPAVTVFEGELM